MPLLQKLLVSGFVPLIGQTLGALHKNSQNSLLLPFLYFSSNFFTNTILNPLGCLYIATSTPHTYTNLSRLRPSLKTLILVGPLRFLSSSSLLKPSTVPQSKRLLCIISSRLLPLYGLFSPTSSL